MEKKDTLELKIEEFEELVSRTTAEMRNKYPGMTIGDIQTIAVFSKMLLENMDKAKGI